MALLHILSYPDPRLRQHAQPVEALTNEIIQLIDDMFETMYHAPGIGLAATQINVAKRVITIDISETCNQPLCLINPEIIKTEGNDSKDEGCLSVPGISEPVIRPAKIWFTAINRNGQLFESKAEGLLATCIQHEIDHLDGKLFIDYLSNLKRNRIRKKIEKNIRQEI